MPEIEITVDADSGQLTSALIRGIVGPDHGTIPQHLSDLLGQPAEEHNTPEARQVVRTKQVRRGNGD